MTAERLILTAAVPMVLLAVAGCVAGCAASEPRVVARILSYNVHNLFDDVDDGGEYAEFTSDAGWTRDAYYRRLDRLGEAVRLVSAGRRLDIVTLQEVESAKVAADLARDFLRGFRYISSGPPGVSTTSVVVLSRRRPIRVRAHRVAELVVVPGSGGAAVALRRPGRDAVDVTFSSPGLRLVAVHWKSQGGGEAATEPQRILEAALVHDVIADDAGPLPVILVGDLNADVDQHRRFDRAWPTAIKRVEDVADAARRFGPLRPGIRFVGAGTGDGGEPGDGGATGDGSGGAASSALVFRSLWEGVPDGGTYRYRGEWSRLDQAFLHAPASYAGTLEVGSHPTLTDRDGGPFGFSPRTGAGYSDHFPILVTLTTARGR